MSTAFTDFLREKAAIDAAEAERGKATVDEWRATMSAFDRLGASLEALRLPVGSEEREPGDPGEEHA
jgi:hypothetical protein